MPLRLAILGQPPCHLCYAACCKQNGHEYAVLLEGDERRRFAPFAIDVTISTPTHPIIEKALPYRDGRCIFLGDDDRCTIYEDRPTHCRRFDCLPAYHHQGARLDTHGDFLLKNPRVARLLDSL